jgi:hypothetical protein
LINRQQALPRQSWFHLGRKYLLGVVVLGSRRYGGRGNADPIAGFLQAAGQAVCGGCVRSEWG